MSLKVNLTSPFESTLPTPPLSKKEELGLTIKIDSLFKSNQLRMLNSFDSIDSPPLKIKQCSHIATTSISSGSGSPFMLTPEVTPVAKDMPRKISIEDEPGWDGTESSEVSDDHLKALITRSKRHQEDTRALPVKDLTEYSLLTGEDRQSNPPLPVESLQASPLGAFLSTLGYDVIRALHVKGNYSYCFLIEGKNKRSQFLKIFKVEKWEHIESSIYSENRGDPCVLGKVLPHVLVPSRLISLKKNGVISTNGEQGDLLLAHISNVLRTKGDLAEYMDHLSDWYKVQRVFHQILHAVCSFKSEHITHRDLKPENILIDFADNVRIIDFAYAVKGEEPCAALQSSYSAPYTEHSHKIDEFSLGLLLLQMCTGVRPHAKNPLSDKTYREEVLEGRLPLTSAIPENLAEMITGLLQTDPHKRLSAEEALKLMDFTPLTIDIFL